MSGHAAPGSGRWHADRAVRFARISYAFAAISVLAAAAVIVLALGVL